MQLPVDQQRLADLIADHFTADDITALCRRLDIVESEIIGPTRQATAENIVHRLAVRNRLPDLVDTLPDIRRDLPDLSTAVTKGSGLSLDLGIELTEAELAGQGGTLSASDGDGQAKRPSQRIVNTGFCEQENPARVNPADTPLWTDEAYYFWLDIGKLQEGSIEAEIVALDTDDLPPEAILQVAVFDFPDGGLTLTAGKDVGELRITPEGEIVVHTAVVRPEDVPPDLPDRRLYFPVHTAAQEGTHQLRCNIYYQQTLLQSRLVTAQVAADPQKQDEQALVSRTDYIISKTLNAARLNEMPAQRLSMMLNDNGGGTHGFRFFGQKQFKNAATLDAHKLQGLIDLARGALRNAAWGDESKFDAARHTYRYTDFNLNRLKIDLIKCAIRGYRIYDVLVRNFGGDTADQTFAELMRAPGQVQIAAKQSARLVIPAALIYDYPLDTGLNGAKMKLCPAFTAALEQKKPLEQCDCFNGDCPSYDAVDTVCPSGFWGYRHMIGLPVTIPNGPDAPVVLPLNGRGPALSVAVSTDPNFVGREQHEAVLKKLHPQLRYSYADQRPETIDLMKKTNPHVLYFFCHGLLSKGTPAIQVGPPRTRGIFRDNLRSGGIRWSDVRPLVIINGCYTTALEPETAIDLVGGFVDTAHAAGVIGTEITNFVPVARVFGEECLRRFLTNGEPIGTAVRGARLKLLQQGNPLGLMYIPYVMPGLRLSDAPPPTEGTMSSTAVETTDTPSTAALEQQMAGLSAKEKVRLAHWLLAQALPEMD